MAKQKTYIAIDLKSFYASVECKERNRDPLTTNLVVADKSRTEKTICLAVSPSLKSYGIPGRPRLFEVVQKVKEANNTRRWKALNRTFTGSSDDSTELNANPALEIDYIVAPPRMAYYLEYSTKIYSVYLKYIAPEDIFPVMSAKCKLCPSCVDGRCFFVPDIYDSVFPCQSPAWDDFFKSGGSRSPAPRARAGYDRDQ